MHIIASDRVLRRQCHRSSVVDAAARTCSLQGQQTHSHPSRRDGRAFSFSPLPHSLVTFAAESLGGNARTCVVTCISPSQKQEAETISTLRFGVRAKKVARPRRLICTRACLNLRRAGYQLRQSQHAALVCRHRRSPRRCRGRDPAPALLLCFWWRCQPGRRAASSSYRRAASKVNA